MKVGNQLIWRKGDIVLGYPGSPMKRQGPIIWKWEAEHGQVDEEWERLNQPWLTLKTEEGTTSQGLQATSRSWKRQGEGFSPPVSSQECSLADILLLAKWDPLTPSPRKYKIIHLGCFQSRFVVSCSSSNGKWVEFGNHILLDQDQDRAPLQSPPRGVNSIIIHTRGWIPPSGSGLGQQKCLTRHLWNFGS